jgi:Mn-dependent DtxR family transcriptional regulator
MDDREKMILDAMKNEGKPMRPGDIAAKTKLDKKEVSKVIAKLKKEGKIDSSRRCFYSPVA